MNSIEILRECQPMNPFESESFRNVLRANLSVTDFLKMDPALEAIRRMTTPNERLLEQFDLSVASQAARLAEIKIPTSLQSALDALGEMPDLGDRVSIDRFNEMLQSATDISRLASERLRLDLDTVIPDRLSELAKSYAAIPDTLSELAKSYAKTFDRSDLLAAISDTTALAEIARIGGRSSSVWSQQLGAWDVETLRQRLDALGIDWTGFESAAGGQPNQEGAKPASPRYRPTPEFWYSLILSLIIALVQTLIQADDAKEAEARHTDEINALDARSEKRIHALEDFLVEAFAAIRTDTGNARVQFVVKERKALIRRDPRSDSPIIGHLTPDDVVELVEDRAKWVKVEYLDSSGEAHAGWALKKYFVRVPRNVRKP